MSAASSKLRVSRLLTAALPFLFVLLLAWLFIGPLWSQPGLPNSADGTLHLHRSAAVTRSWAAGVLWPRWFLDVYQGLGAPTFHYYSPLFYLAVAPLHLLGLPLDLCAKLVITFFFLLSGLATWAWLRRLMGSTAGLAGAALYLSQPHLFREYYFQGDYPQLLALFLLPVVLWAFTELCLDGGWPGRLAAPPSLVLLILAHNITAMLGAAVLGLYSLALLLWRRDLIGWLRLVAGVGLGLGLGAFFWLPAVGDTGMVRVENLQEGFFHFAQYFVPWRDLLAAPPIFDGRAANPPFPHMLGWAAWLFLGAGVVVFVMGLLRRSRRSANWFWAGMGLAFVGVCLFLTQPWSTLIWEYAPLIAWLEFPSRWLGVAGVGVALVGGAVAVAWGERRSWLVLSVLVLVVALSSGVFLFTHQPFRSVDEVRPYETRVYELRSYAWGLTSGNEFLPRWAGQTQPEAAKLVQEQQLPAGVEWEWDGPHRATLRAASGSTLPAGGVVLPVHYFPGWGALADGVPVRLAPDGQGLAYVNLPRPASELLLQWQGTILQKVGQWISLLALLGWIVWVAWAVRRGMGRRPPVPVEASPRGIRAFVPLILLILLILIRGAIQLSGARWLQQSSPPDRVSGVANPLYLDLGVGEGDQPGVTLLGWELLSDAPQPGGQVLLRLYWQRQNKITEVLHSLAFVYTPATLQSWAAVQNHNPGNIPTINWSPKLYYIDDLTLELPADLPPATYTLAVGMVDSQGQRLDVPGQQDDLVYLEEISVEPLQAGRRQLLQPEVPARAAVGGSLALQGYDLLAEPGGPVLRLYWEVLDTPGAVYQTFVHLVDAGGQMVAQFDGPPLSGLLPTSQWTPGSLLIDRRKIDLPQDLAGGDYRFLVGLYGLETGTRLPVQPQPDSEQYFEGDALGIPLQIP